MKKIFKYFSFLPILVIMLASCTPEEFTLGDKDVESGDLVEGIAFKIEHDATNPNIIHLTSLMGPEYTPLWNHPQGRSQAEKVTLEIPFAGTYDVQFGVETRGGIVYGDTVTFKVDNIYAGFISDPMWTMISGGADHEKTWYLDLDAQAVSRYFPGPLYFYGTEDSWESAALYREGTSGDDVKKALGIVDSWHWDPDYKGNSWLMSAVDFGSITFDLKGGANISVTHSSIASRGTEKGTYMLDTKNHTLKIQGAAILHDSNRDGVVINWGDLKILNMTDSTMQLAALRDPALSGEGACLLVYNFISKDYKDHWVPGVVVEPEPALPEGWQTAISQTVNKSVKWVLSPKSPFNWANPDGSFMNDWTSPETYASWTGFTAASAADYAKFSLTLNSDNNSAVYVAPDGTSTSGTYTLDEKGIYTFTNIKPNFVICGGWVTCTTTDANQWRITKIEKDPTGAVTGMWVGKRDPVKPEYMVYHLIPQVGGDVVVDPLSAWKNAFAGKTFKPDTGWFADWLNYDQTGGWTSAATFGTDFTSNSWIWNEKTSQIAQSASLKFTKNGSDLMVTLTQDLLDANGNVTTAGYTISGKVIIDAEKPSMTFEFPLFDYSGSPASWVNKSNPKGVNWTKALTENEWIFVSHGGSDLSTIATTGFWLGAVANSVTSGDSKDELFAFHFVLAP